MTTRHGCPYTEWVVSSHPYYWYVYAICDAVVERLKIANGARLQLNFPEALAEGLASMQEAITQYHDEFHAIPSPTLLN